jgi:hypothetical protein
MEVRGVGIIDFVHVGQAPVALLVDLVDTVDRMPLEPSRRTVAGMQVPVAKVDPRAASAPIKVELALRALTAR